MLESFFVYTSLLIILPFLGHTANQYLIRNDINRLYLYWGFLFCVIFIFTIVFGARNNVGIDYANYKHIYETIRDGRTTDDVIEPGFYLICKIFGNLNLHHFFFFSFFCFIQIYFVITAFKNNTKIIPYILIILLSTQFMAMMTLIRQMTFVCIFIWVVSRINSLSFIKYATILLICTFIFHKSAILFLPMYFLIRVKKSLCLSYYFQIIFYLLSLYLGYTGFILDKFEDLTAIASLLGYSQYEGFNVIEAMFMDPNWGPRTFIRFLLMFVTILMSNKVKFYFKYNITFIQFYNLFFWGVCAETILYGTNIISRVFLPMYYMKLVIYAFTLYYIVNNFKKNYNNLFISCCYVGLLFLDYCSLYYEISLPDNTSTFKFFWQN